MVLHRLARGLFSAEPREARRSGGALAAAHGRHAGTLNSFDPSGLFKLIIPATCLVFIGWIWMTMSGG
jgi:hypothetical protein